MNIPFGDDETAGKGISASPVKDPLFPGGPFNIQHQTTTKYNKVVGADGPIPNGSARYGLKLSTQDL